MGKNIHFIVYAMNGVANISDSMAQSEQKVIIGNCLDVLRSMESESIDVCVTSPPYWGLRDYGDSTIVDYDGWVGQLGLEQNPLDYIKHLCLIFNEVKRVLKPTGACWVNIADTYATVSGSGFQNDKISAKKERASIGKGNDVRKTLKEYGFQSKTLCQIPSRFAIAMTDNGGWILRNSVIWHKPNPMPMSVKDRFTNDYEMFFFFVKNRKYYFKQQFEPIKEESIARAKRAKHNTLDRHDVIRGTNAIEMKHNDPNWQRFANPKGRNCRTTWTIPTKGEKYIHIAMFPEALIERPIDACCPDGGVVLDPFCGSGTTLAYCRRKNINAIGIEIDPKNKDIINNRLNKINNTNLNTWVK